MSSRGGRTLKLLLILALVHPFATGLDTATATGELRLAGPVSGLDSLDPAVSRDTDTNSVLRQIFRGLVGFDDELRPVPELAEAVTASADGMIYDVRLRNNATFHDGSPIEADDVVFSLTRAVSPATVDGDITRLGGPSFLGAIDGFAAVVSGDSPTLRGLTVVDRQNLRIALSAPQATFVMALAAVPASIVDRAQVETDDAWSSRPNGSGPFRVESWEPRQRLTLEAHDGFALGSPAVDRVTYRLGADALQPFNLFQAGLIDLDSVSPLQADGILAQQESLGATIVQSPAFSLTYMAFRTDIAPLDDVHVRRALLMAFPRDRVARITMDGEVTVAQGLIPDGMLGRGWGAELPGYDVEAAKEELALSRYGNPETVPTVRIDTAGSYGAEPFLTSIENGLGIDVEIVDHDPATFYAGLARGAYMAHEVTWGADYPDPATFLGSLFGSSSPDNYVGFADAEVDRLLAEANLSPDEAVRATLYAEAQQRILDAAVVIPLFHDVHRTLVRDGISGVTVTPMGILRLESISVSS